MRISTTTLNSLTPASNATNDMNVYVLKNSCFSVVQQFVKDIHLYVTVSSGLAVMFAFQ